MTEDRRTSRGGSYPMRTGSPPPFEFFSAPRPALGARGVRLRLGRISIDLVGLDTRRADDLLSRFSPYALDAGPADSEALRVAVCAEAKDYFIEPPARPEFNPIFLDAEPDRVRYLGYKVAAWLEPRGRRGQVLLARGEFEPDLAALENFLRVGVAWRAAALGGALVHAASALRNGRAYLFYGESGAGKSTLAASTRRAVIVSDDLSLVLPDERGGLALVGSPFRGTYEGGEPVQGSFPLAAGFRLIQDKEPAVRHVPRVRAMAELVGNLPFVAEAFAQQPELLEAIGKAFAAVPLAHLHFRPDDSYWDAIESAGL